ncbi:hypothetical protein QE152_g20725 [Popillia japonica]|uniref:Uncharacterized protein n=1 Tax=Popillia japonica TaxID=7064 RepID=A0AAW1KNV1_POPJA
MTGLMAGDNVLYEVEGIAVLSHFQLQNQARYYLSNGNCDHLILTEPFHFPYVEERFVLCCFAVLDKTVRRDAATSTNFYFAIINY